METRGAKIANYSKSLVITLCLLILNQNLAQAQLCQPVLNGAKLFIAFECLNDSTVLIVDSSKADIYGWQYSHDSSKDGVTFGQNGGGDFEIYGMAFKETTEYLYIVINANLPIQGFPSNAAVDGNIGWGDIFIDLNSDNFENSHAEKAFYGIRFAANNESGTTGTGVFSKVTAKTVTHLNSGFNNWLHYKNHLAGKGVTPVLGDLGENQTYYGDKTNFNVINEYEDLGQLEFLSMPDLIIAGFDHNYFSGITHIGFRLTKRLIIDECGVLGGDGSTCKDCSGVACGTKTIDQCGVCGGDGTSCLDCQGTVNGHTSVDQCGVCGGDGTSCLDCAGNVFGTATVDRCGVCNGDGLSCLGCKEENHSETIFKLDGAGATLKHLSYSMTKLLKHSKLSKKQRRKIRRSIINTADTFFIETWSAAWSMPAKHIKCENSLYCNVIKDNSLIQNYEETLANFVKFAKTNARKIKRIVGNSKKLKEIVKDIQHAEQLAQQELATIPSDYYKCVDG